MQNPGGSAVLAAIVDALSQLDARGIVTTGVDNYGVELASLPDDIEVRRFAEHREIIPWSPVVVTHGGAGTVQDALLMGRPMVVLPHFADQFHNAARVDEDGFGTALVGNEQTADRIAQRVADTLTGRFDAPSQRIASQAHHLPTLEEHVPRLEALTDRRREGKRS